MGSRVWGVATRSLGHRKEAMGRCGDRGGGVVLMLSPSLGAGLKQELFHRHKEAQQCCRPHNLPLLRAAQQREMEVRGEQEGAATPHCPPRGHRSCRRGSQAFCYQEMLVVPAPELARFEGCHDPCEHQRVKAGNA